MRREDILSQQEKEYIKLQENKGYRYWINFWKALYQVVSIASYMGMIVAVGFAYYYSIINADLQMAIPAYLIVLLLAYVNKINPK